MRINWTAIAAAGLGLAVIVGAFGAHALKGQMDESSAGIYEKAAFYHFVHMLAMLLVSLMPRLGMITEPQSGNVCLLLTIGVLLFSGSLYLLAVTKAPALGAVTPLGGVSFILAWTLLVYYSLRKN